MNQSLNLRMFDFKSLLAPIFAALTFFGIKMPTPPQSDFLLIRCSIFNSERKLIRSYPGFMCDFAPDGSFVSHGERLNYYSPRNELLWSLPGPFHHQVKFSEDQKTILTLGSEVLNGVRYDTVVRTDRSGRIEKVFRFSNFTRDLYRWARRPEGRHFLFKDRHFPGVHWESSHANAIYELPSSNLEDKHTAFKAGNYLVTISNLGLVVILDRDLKQILWSFSHPEAFYGVIHDVQLLPEGRLLVYNNAYGKRGQWQTVLEEIDPLSGKVLWRHKPPDKFAIDAGGGVQKLRNGNILFSDTSKVGRVVEISPAGEEVWTLTNPFEIPEGQTPLYIQEAKKRDFSDFLKNNPGF